jgi:peptidoglycan-associated lipoprotein
MSVKERPMMRTNRFLPLLSVLFILEACGEAEKKPPVVPSAPTATQGPMAQPQVDPATVDSNPNRGQLNIDESIRKACGITDIEAYFSFDSANVQPAYRALLKKLADCFTTGPLSGRRMRLVGHADPRGEDNYNLVLGGQRADNVKKTIVGEGLVADKIETSSRGEMDAVGTDESGWSKDRRVDVQLGD